MSNKTVSVYADAFKRQQEEQANHSPTQTTTPLNSYVQKQPPQEVDLEKTPEEKPIFQAKPQEEISQEKSPSRDSYPASTLDSKLSRYHDSSIEFLRKSVRFSGKDAFFGRFTPEEKGLLKEIVYTYQRRGIKTTENEIARIAINLLTNDYQENGEDSILGRVLKAVHE